MNPEYGRIYRSLYERHWWWRARESWLVLRLRHWIPEGVAAGRKVLDVGCGDRLSFGVLSKWGEVQGVEADRELLSAESLADPRLHVGAFVTGVAVQGPFDLITALDVIEHMEDDRPALSLMHGLLRDGGILIVHVPARMSLWTRHDDANYHYRRYSEVELSTRVKEAGFEVLELVGCFWFTVPLKWLQSKLERMGVGSAESAALPNIPPEPINWLLIQICRLEQAFYPVFKSYFGSSLCLVARKSPTRPQLKPQ